MGGHERFASLVPDDLWEAIEPLLPKEPPKPKGGRPRVPDRAALAGIVFVLRTGLPLAVAAAGAGLRQRLDLLAPAAGLAAAGVWERLHDTAPELAGRRGRHRLVAGERGQPQRAGQKGGEQTGPNPTDRGKAGSKYHVVVDRNGIPLAVRLSAANAHDSTQLLPLIDAIPPIIGPRGRPGRPRKRPAKLHADKAYDSSALRRALRARGITPRLARRGRGVARAARAVPLGGGADAGVAARVSPPRGALRAAGRPPAGVAPPGLRPHLPALPSSGRSNVKCPRPRRSRDVATSGRCSTASRSSNATPCSGPGSATSVLPLAAAHFDGTPQVSQYLADRVRMASGVRASSAPLRAPRRGGFRKVLGDLGTVECAAASGGDGGAAIRGRSWRGWSGWPTAASDHGCARDRRRRRALCQAQNGEEAQADQGAGQVQQPLEQIRPPLVADAEPADSRATRRACRSPPSGAARVAREESIPPPGNAVG